jgi:hypothetical protein
VGKDRQDKMGENRTRKMAKTAREKKQVRHMGTLGLEVGTAVLHKVLRKAIIEDDN